MSYLKSKHYRRAGRLMREKIGCCQLCSSKKKLTIDHIIPISKGGSKGQCNWQVLCQKCNSEKADSYPQL